MYSDRINCYRPEWCSPPEVCVPARRVANSSAEEASLPSDVVEHFYIITCNHLPTMLYNEVHAQRSLAFINIVLHFLYELRVLVWQKRAVGSVTI